MLNTDAITEVTAEVPQMKKPSVIKIVRDPVLSYRQSWNYGRGAFNISEYDLSEINEHQIMPPTN